MSAFTGSVYHVQQYLYDFAVDGGAVGKKVLSAKPGYTAVPVGSIVKAVTALVATAVTTAASGTLEWGNDDDEDGYSGAAKAAGVLTAGAVFNGWDFDAALLWDGTNDHAIPVYVADAADGEVSASIATGALTAGKVAIMLEFLFPAV